MNRKLAPELLAYGLATATLVCTVVLIRRDYQDSWVLEDILFPTIAYVLIYVVAIVRTTDNRIVTVLSSSFIVVLNAIPSLKYELFSGTYDAVGHYGFINRLISTSHVPESGFYAALYHDFPGMHIFVSSLSLILGIPTNTSVKLVTSLVSGTIPLMVYFATNHMFDKGLQRTILIASGIPSVALLTLSGDTFGITIYFAFMCVLLRMGSASQNTLSHLLVLLVLGYALLFSHPVSTIFLLIGLTAMALLVTMHGVDQGLATRVHRDRLAAILLILLLSFTALQILSSGSILKVLVGETERILLGEPAKLVIPERFFALPILAQLSMFLVLHVRDLTITAMSLGGLAVILLRFRLEAKTLFTRFYLPLLFVLLGVALILPVQLILRFGDIEYQRAIGYAIMFQPFLLGVLLWRLRGSSATNTLKAAYVALIVLLTISVGFIQMYSYQPMVPTANAVSPDLPDDEYVLDLGIVNSVYKVELISFAQRFSTPEARVTSDDVTRWQIYGFTDPSFNSRHIWFSPLDYSGNLQWDVFLLCYDGPAGAMQEKAEYRTHARISMLRDTLGNVVYDSGECFIMSQP